MKKSANLLGDKIPLGKILALANFRTLELVLHAILPKSSVLGAKKK